MSHVTHVTRHTSLANVTYNMSKITCHTSHLPPPDHLQLHVIPVPPCHAMVTCHTKLTCHTAVKCHITVTCHILVTCHTVIHQSHVTPVSRFHGASRPTVACAAPRTHLHHSASNASTCGSCRSQPRRDACMQGWVKRMYARVGDVQ